jgi:hypothetical protein
MWVLSVQKAHDPLCIPLFHDGTGLGSWKVTMQLQATQGKQLANAAVLKEATLPSSGPPPAWPAPLLLSMFRCAGQAGGGPLMSNVRTHK